MNTVFHAQTAADLGAPLMQALTDAEKNGVATLRIELAAGDYGAAPVQLAPLDSPGKVAIEMIAPAGPAVFHGPISIEAPSVTLSGLVLDHPQVGNSALSVRAAGAIRIDGVAVIGTVTRDRGRDALVQLAAVGPGTSATIERLWLVHNKLEGGGTLLAFRQVGRGSFDTASVSRSVFAGNKAGSGVATAFTKSVSFDRVAVIEPTLGGVWLDVRSPITKIRIADSLVATKNLADHAVDEDSKLADFPRISTSSLDLRGPSKKEHVDPKGATFGKAIGAPADWAFVLEPARTLAAPDLAALAGAL